MRADEFIPPTEQINILIRVASQARVDLQDQLNATDQQDSLGDSSLDFFKKILDMTFDEISQWGSSTDLKMTLASIQAPPVRFSRLSQSRLSRM